MSLVAIEGGEIIGHVVVSPGEINGEAGDWYGLGPAPGRVGDVLCLASGGGQQGPILAAADAQVTVSDASPMQLAQDDLVARGEHLDLKTVQGFMDDLSIFADGAFDLIFHPVSNN